MQINIKQMILEGYSYDEITEAVHANHPNLNKSRLKDPNLSYKEGKQIEQNRKRLADEINGLRKYRDGFRKLSSNQEKALGNDNAIQFKKYANHDDNIARALSQTGGNGSVGTKELKEFSYSEKDKIIKNVPRIISSANK